MALGSGQTLAVQLSAGTHYTRGGKSVLVCGSGWLDIESIELPIKMASQSAARCGIWCAGLMP